MKLSISKNNMSLFLLTGLLVYLLSGCNTDNSNKPLNSENTNLIFVVSADLAYHDLGDISADTANLTGQGLHRSLLMATYLKEQVLGNENVTSIYALEPMTHLQTEHKYPDMAAIGSIQQFALLNQQTLPSDDGEHTAYSFPINVSYGKGSVPDGVWTPSDNNYCPHCKGLDFADLAENNINLATEIITKNTSGFYVFSAPWETISRLMEKINQFQGEGLDVPSSYNGSNHIYVISITPSGETSLVTYDSKVTPSETYPELPSPVVKTSSCSYTYQKFADISRVSGVDGVVIPDNINTNQKIHFVRHAEAHSDENYHFENGNFVAAGQWRALSLSSTLLGQIAPDMVYSVDPAQWFPIGDINVSYVRPSLTILPYVIANNLPYHLVSSFSILDKNQGQLTNDFFFKGGKFSDKTLLVAWESLRIKPVINILLESYGGSSLTLLPEEWASPDYDTIWTVTLDELGNIRVDNGLCEGVESDSLPVEAPQF